MAADVKKFTSPIFGEIELSFAVMQDLSRRSKAIEAYRAEHEKPEPDREVLNGCLAEIGLPSYPEGYMVPKGDVQAVESAWDELDRIAEAFMKARTEEIERSSG
ncbi:MAG: hypothetical protein JRF63_01835 [Deltaproteobacteria bacterium]|nr:hypothetical protein [Deltaproteobacteria bacterium]